MSQIPNSKNHKSANHKRIGIISYTLPPAISGVEMVIRDHARLLSNSGYRVFLLGALGKSFRSEIDVHIARSFDPKNSIVRQIQSELKEEIISNLFEQTKKKYFNIIKKWLEKNRLDFVIIHNVLSRHYNLALTAAISDIAKTYKNRVKFINWVHDASFVDMFYTKVKDTHRNIYPWSLISNYQSEFTYITISQTRKAELLKLYGKDTPITVVPNGIDLNKMLPLPLQTRILFKDILVRNPDYIGIIPVRIAERKNIEYAIEFVKIAQQQYNKNFMFIVTGALHLQNAEAIHYYSFLKNKIKQEGLEKNFIFLYEHKLSNNEKFDIYKLNIKDLYLISDFLFLPSKGEGFGLPIIEAGFVRIPIFVADLPVFKEVGNGYINLFSIDKPINLTVEKILDYLKKSRTTIFHKQILKKYSLESIVKNYLIDQLLN